MIIYLELFLNVFRAVIQMLDSFHISEHLTMLDFLIYSTISILIINLVANKIKEKNNG